MTNLTTERLRELLRYEPREGLFYWQVSTSNRVRSGAVAGCLTPNGYWKIGVDGRRYQAQRLAWFYMTGAWPEGDVDHRDGDRINNRWRNLRAATRTQNNANAKRHKTNTTGFKGVHLFKQTGRYQAGITINGKRKHLGYFPTAGEAHAVYVKAAEKHFGEFARAA